MTAIDLIVEVVLSGRGIPYAQRRLGAGGATDPLIVGVEVGLGSRALARQPATQRWTDVTDDGQLGAHRAALVPTAVTTAGSGDDGVGTPRIAM
jgi:hypothetical protein